MEEDGGVITVRQTGKATILKKMVYGCKKLTVHGNREGKLTQFARGSKGVMSVMGRHTARFRTSVVRRLEMVAMGGGKKRGKQERTELIGGRLAGRAPGTT